MKRLTHFFSFVLLVFFMSNTPAWADDARGKQDFHTFYHWVNHSALSNDIAAIWSEGMQNTARREQLQKRFEQEKQSLQALDIRHPEVQFLVDYMQHMLEWQRLQMLKMTGEVNDDAALRQYIRENHAKFGETANKFVQQFGTP